MTEFRAELGAFGRVGTATLTVPAHALRSVEFQRSPAGSLPLELRLGDALLFGGDVSRVVRDIDGGMVELSAQSYMARLEAQRWPGGARQPFAAAMLAEQCASRAGLKWTKPESPLDSRPLSIIADGDGATGDSIDARRLLLWLSRECGYDFAVDASGELHFGPPAAGAPCDLEARALLVTTFEQGGPLAVVVRSEFMRPGAGGMQRAVLRSGMVGAVEPGVATYLFGMHSRQNQPQIDALAERLTGELTHAAIAVEAECDRGNPTLAVGAAVRITAEGVRDLTLRVMRVEHQFTTDSGLRTRFEAVYFSRPPAISDTIDVTAPSVATARVYCSCGLAA